MMARDFHSHFDDVMTQFIINKRTDSCVNFVFTIWTKTVHFTSSFVENRARATVKNKLGHHHVILRVCNYIDDKNYPNLSVCKKLFSYFKMRNWLAGIILSMVIPFLFPTLIRTKIIGATKPQTGISNPNVGDHQADKTLSIIPLPSIHSQGS